MALHSHDEAVVHHSDLQGNRCEQEDKDHPMGAHEERPVRVEESDIDRAIRSSLLEEVFYDDSHLDGGYSHGEVALRGARRSIHHLQEGNHHSHDEVASASVVRHSDSHQSEEHALVARYRKIDD